jgi:hypothetical protein
MAIDAIKFKKPNLLNNTKDRATAWQSDALAGYNFGPATLNVWAADEFSANVSGGSSALSRVETASIIKLQGTCQLQFPAVAPDEPELRGDCCPTNRRVFIHVPNLFSTCPEAALRPTPFSQSSSDASSGTRAGSAAQVSSAANIMAAPKAKLEAIANLNASAS